MTKHEYWRFLCSSPLGMGCFGLSAAAGLATGFSAGLSLGVAAGAGCLVLCSVLSLVTGLGAKAAAREEERIASARVISLLDAAGAARGRLAALRLPAGELASARDLCVLEAGRFIEACAASEKESPGASGEAAAAAPAISEALELVNAWLGELDETSIEKRFGAEDAHPLPPISPGLARGEAANQDEEARGATERVVAALKAKARALVRGRDLALGKPPAADAIAIEEELR